MTLRHSPNSPTMSNGTAHVQAAYQLDHRPSEQEVLAMAEKWRPYRSLATSYLFSAEFEPRNESRAASGPV
jgi:3-methyladenine DNA glycosylase/8-oxoguanine DNA glycosylase